MSENITFEQAISRLEEIVKGLERGDAPLDASLTLFKEGTELISKCSKMLDGAEQTVVLLSKNTDGTISEMPFKEEE